MNKLFTAIFAAILGMLATSASACEGAPIPGSTVCAPPPTIEYRGSGGLRPTLQPEACLTQEAIRLMTGPGVDFWFTYYLRYPNGSAEDMEPVIRTHCVTQQWVSARTRIGFWVDCHDPVDGRLYRWWWETAPITNNGRYEMRLIQKQLIG